ncbi:NFACT RNA binding domain-containing protein [Pendulispora albinea]|uniref:NFACT RNA binding domain-containing protein n=1 Tax=Pendulispora albinea TaxID=2741071 RepID=A0ABZ2M473_9BACT
MSNPPQKDGRSRDSTREDALALTSALTRARKRLSQRVLAIQRDLDRIDEAEAWAARAPWLVAAAARAPRGARFLEVSDWSPEGEEQKLTFPLDPSRTAREQVEAAFQRARRLRRGRPLAGERLAEAKRAIVAVDELRAELHGIVADDEGARDGGMGDGGELRDGERNGDSAPSPLGRLAELRQRAIAALPHDVRGVIPGAVRPISPKAKALSEGRKPPFRTFTARSGMRILVGRRAELNDELTFQVSRPYHLWLHAKDQPGAHVIAWNEKGKALTEAELADAACLAGHFSEARGEPIIDVTYTPRRYVRKPRRAPPGLVIADRAKVFSVRIDPAHLKALLATEVEG